MIQALKFVHVSTVIITFAGFLLRGYWMMTGSAWLGHRITRIAPHVIDTLLLASGIGLIVSMRLPVLSQAWLLMKFVALVAYIILGAIALGRGKSFRARVTAFCFAVAVFAYIVGVAISKSTMSWISLAGG